MQPRVAQYLVLNNTLEGNTRIFNTFIQRNTLAILCLGGRGGFKINSLDSTDCPILHVRISSIQQRSCDDSARTSNIPNIQYSAELQKAVIYVHNLSGCPEDAENDQFFPGILDFDRNSQISPESCQNVPEMPRNLPETRFWRSTLLSTFGHFLYFAIIFLRTPPPLVWYNTWY